VFVFSPEHRKLALPICGRANLRLSKKAKPFLTKGLRPAAAHKSSARSERFPRLQAEKYFLPRTRRGKKSLTSILLLRQQNSTRFFDNLKLALPICGRANFYV